jgi:CHAT domain-containing protein
MAHRDPATREGKLWLGEFNREFVGWLGSGQQDDAKLAAMGAALTKLFERAPDYAPTLQTIAVGASFLAHRHGPRAAAFELASTGLLAAAVSAEPPASAARLAALQAYYLAEIHLAAGRRFDGLAALARVGEELARVDSHDPLRRYVRALASRLEGELHELGLEHQRAGDAYSEAADFADEILRSDFERVGTAVLDAVLGGNPAFGAVLGQLLPLILADLSSTLIGARFGIVRTLLAESADSGIDTAEVDTAVHAAWAAADAHAMPSTIAAIDVFQAVAALPAVEAAARVEKLLTWAKTNAGAMFADWRALLEATLGRRHADDGDGKAAAAAHKRAARFARDGATPFIAALVHGMELADCIAAGSRAQGAMARFVAALGELARTGDLDLRDLRRKALLDAPVAAAIRLAFVEFEADPSPRERVRLGLLIDSLRQSEWAPLPPERAEHGDTALAYARETYAHAIDRLQRIAHAVQRRQGTLALVVQACGDATLFLCISAGGSPPIAGYFSDATHRRTSRALARAAAQGLAAPGGPAYIAAAGRAVFDALPPAVRQQIDRHHTILVAPDFRSNEDSVPFELIHDGTAFLALSRVMARVASLRDMAGALEAVSPTIRTRRALITSAPQVDGHPPLQFAEDERARVTEAFKARGWDAPPIAADRLTPQFFLDRLKYVALLHVAAHGQATAGTEALILPQGERLTADDLLKKRFPTMPLVYLNTCLLAHTRYLGGGVSRGIAHTLFELGAPAVIANMSPVYDKVATDLSEAFYRHAVANPVGEALRLARGELAVAGVPPSLWGATVLIGDPARRLDPSGSEESHDVVAELLDAYMPEGSELDRTAAYSRTLELVGSDEGNVRAVAGLGFVQAASRLSAVETREDEEALDLMIEIASELHHLPAMAMMRTVKATHLTQSGVTDERTIGEIDRAVMALDALQGTGPAWDRLKQQLLARKKAMNLSAQGLQRRYTGEWSAADKRGADAMLDIMAAVQQAEESERGAVGLRSSERTLRDLAHNAIVIGWPNRFEDMREAAAYVTTLVSKLVQRGFMPAAAQPAAEMVLTGVLHDLWGRQHSVGLQPDLVEGWSNTLVEAIHDVARSWANPDAAPWQERLAQFAQHLNETLAFLEACTYDEVYTHLDTRFKTLAAEATRLLDDVATSHPDAISASYGWLVGTIVRRNTYSPLDGSVPEDIDNRMKRLASELWTSGEQHMARYLMDGFAAVRNREWDELERWRLDVDPEKYEAIKAGMVSHKPAPPSP